jgi:hypothetical protein
MKKRYKRGKQPRNCSGFAIAELGAALMLLLPLTIAICFVAAEVMEVCMIKSVLNHGAAVAARRLAIAYGTNPAAAIANPEESFSNLKVANVIVDERQFNVPPGTAGWNLYSNPPTVTVEVTFRGGMYGLPAFPNPDLLCLGTNFSVTSTATANLQ